LKLLRDIRTSRHNHTDVAENFREQAKRLKQALETSAWDGHWYRRVYFDDGTPLGSAQNREAQQ